MNGRIGSVNAALAVAVPAAVTAYAITYATKHYVPSLWLLWLGSAAIIAFAFSWWKPQYWGLAAVSTPSLVLLEMILKLGDAPPTAAALGLGLGVLWALTGIVGALLGRQIRRLNC